MGTTIRYYDSEQNDVTAYVEALGELDKGITLRDHLAGYALLRDALWCLGHNEGWGSDEVAAQAAYAMADTMLKAGGGERGE